jgi:5-methylcytosine-specific restriction protein B
MSVPQGVTVQHVRRALEMFDQGVDHPYAASRGYDLVVGSDRYPPKAIAGLAARVAGGAFPRGMGGGDARQLLTSLGFEVVAKPGSEAPEGFRLSDAAIRRLVEAAPAEAAKLAHSQEMIAAFQQRFDIDGLIRLSGRDLLLALHGRHSHDSLAYWLEFKRDSTFDTARFGSIRGGSALKFGIYQRQADDKWCTGHSTDMRELDEADAIEIATAQRDELVAATRLVTSLPPDPSTAPWRSLQADMQAAAPTINQLAFVHKFLHLQAPERLDDFHRSTIQSHVLTSLGRVPAGDGLYDVAADFVAALQQFREELAEKIPMHGFTHLLNGLVGAQHGHWRIGTTIDDADLFPGMERGEFVGIGWAELGDLAEIVGAMKPSDARDAIKRELVRAFGPTEPSLLGRQAAQIWRFYSGVHEGDRVYPCRGQEVRAIAEVTGAYQFVGGDDETLAHRRSVRWLSRASFKSPTKSGLRTTLYDLSRDHVLQAAAARHLDIAPQPRRTTLASGPIAEQLERKGQIVLYGPPGTGKTYEAERAAREIVARGRFALRWVDLTKAQQDELVGRGDPAGQRIWFCTFHPAYGYEDFVEGLKPKPSANGGLDFAPEPGLFKRICRAAAAAGAREPHVLIIDEFNRGDAPRIFGELLTLVELDKRERTSVVLPYSGDAFEVPANVRIIATMNTADRSISHLDAALRRRFAFVELMPDPSVLDGAVVDSVSLSGLLGELNKRLMKELGDRGRNLQVGHAYLMRAHQPLASVRDLQHALQHDVFPLLQEYCGGEPRALSKLVGSVFYEVESQRFSAEIFAAGNESQFRDALIDWAPDDIGSDSPVTDGSEADDDELEPEADVADGA